MSVRYTKAQIDSIATEIGTRIKNNTSAATIKTNYESNANTNAFTDAEKTKLASIDATHYLAPVQDTTALAALTEASLTDKARVFVEDATTDYFYNATAGSGDIAPADQTGGTGFWLQVTASGETAASIKTKYESNADTNAFTDAEQTKLAGITTGATANDTDANLLARANHTGTQLAATISDFSTAADARIAAASVASLTDVTDAGSGAIITAAERTKLSGIETGATADTDAANITDFTTALDAALV